MSRARRTFPSGIYPGSEFPGAAGSLSQTNGEVALAYHKDKVELSSGEWR